MSYIVALMLFVILCPCVSYIIVKRKIVPWTGGVYLIMGDDKKVRVDFNDLNRDEIPYDSVVKGIFLSGARANMMPKVSLRRFLRSEEQEFSVEMKSYYLHEEEDGVYHLFCRPMKASEFRFFYVDVFAPYPWRGYKSRRGDDYYAWAEFVFAESPIFQKKLPDPVTPSCN